MSSNDLFNNGNSEKDARQGVIIYFQYGHDDLKPLHDLENKLRKQLYTTGTGELDGHQMALDLADGFLYLYGTSAEELFKAIRPILVATPFMRKAEINLRFAINGGNEVSDIDFVLE